ncbi:hypothetical protein A2291_00125 [candidate division WOR-1 bacterium RIFOXYB2_FULL_42_35]|uniref:Response regulatory domain-containing protein n=1 Tax=candidate division WOR-1 bacterium RIFOXYC2_FULL_41_25 TaxID=1802586 RepID=A0A1F4TP15_UNCSA|nr:MAG: hypothetical protein A2247_05645 [candidate division WOR-1 bacterium RIFOXYA2_FULL_41_14]OGC24126.1 MAG: hypothetical protein A2291_00125 [candidate division WOR-1 bacterium RIFOXYB2_FULL_42_35]OGC33813.1 MAG: hypothetical protein A2462_01800 [candidate division WOR-1 bacterium RIFOXYC2_FULL_41_25]OGC43706.1 MAG: hypothetical protein A2548_05350 [candidate division WOR-1 bacterium RIFOXYD2_FULL_41_8]
MTDKKRRILIVEDEVEMLKALQLRLEANGYEVLTAQDGLSGLNKARSEKPDLILLDVMLPKMDGFKICRMLKFDQDYKNIPVIILTAKVQDSDVEQGLAMGADAYMTKPYKADELVGKIKELLGD